MDNKELELKEEIVALKAREISQLKERLLDSFKLWELGLAASKSINSSPESHDSGYGSSGSSEDSSPKKLLKEQRGQLNKNIVRVFKKYLLAPLNKETIESPEEILSNFKAEFGEIGKSGLKFEWSWKMLDEALLFEDQSWKEGRMFGRFENHENVGAGIRKVCLLFKILHSPDFIRELITSYEKEFKPVSKLEIIENCFDSDNCNVLHYLALTISEKSESSFITKDDWLTYNYLKETFPSLLEKKNSFGRTPADIIEEANLEFDEQFLKVIAI